VVEFFLRVVYMSCPFCNSNRVKTISVFKSTAEEKIIEVKCGNCGLVFVATFRRKVGLNWSLVKVKPRLISH
jgi:transcription elongation factor Elf1